MSTQPATSLDEGRQRLGDLLLRLQPLGQLSSEAETRFQFLDELLTQCLGWEKTNIHVEVHEDRDYTDYELGNPRTLIWEAKRAGREFDIPINQTSRKPLLPLQALLANDSELAAAITQCQGYCANRGVAIGVVSNGRQIIAFLAVRTDGVPPLKGRAFVVNGEAQLLSSFNILWRTLSPAGVAEGHLSQLLSAQPRGGIPKKLSASLLEYPRFRYRNSLQDDLRTVADLLLEDVTTVPDIEPEFYKQCYCETGALSQYALITKDILQARYSALFDAGGATPTISPLTQRPATGLDNPDSILAQAVARRPIVLIGDVGVGKTSFVKNLIYVSAPGEFANAIHIYLDLGSQGALQADLQKFVVDEIERQLFERYATDVYRKEFVRAVYDLDVKRFRSGVWGDLYDSDRERYEEHLREFLGAQQNDKAQHLKKSIHHISRGRKQQVILILDNADQRDLLVQQAAFVIAQNFARDWEAAVFIAVRPQTFHQSKRAGALSAYPHKVFTISPPRPEVLLQKRLVFALDMAEGRLPVERLQGIRLNLQNLALFLKALLNSLERNRELIELLANITGGNMRAVVELITRFISTPNVDTDKIIDFMRRTNRYLIPLHEFSKVVILGDYAHYNPNSSLALNVFDVSFPDQREHFLALLIVGYLDHDGPHRNLEAFVRTESVIAEMQNLGFLPQQTSNALRKLTNKRLIETTERVTFEEDPIGELVGEMPGAFRITTVGAYHLKRWAGTFAYLDAMAFDTPIFDEDAMRTMARAPNSFDLVERFLRARRFRDYLTKTWEEMAVSPSYFDWRHCLTGGQRTFEAVETVVRRQGRADKLPPDIATA